MSALGGRAGRRKGAGIVVTTTEASDSIPQVLIGHESRWLSDVIPIKENQRFRGTRDEAYAAFRDRVMELSRNLRERIQFSQLTVTETNLWHTRFHHLMGRSSWGVPKGGLEGDEEPLVAARREFEEEVGYSLSAHPDGDFTVVSKGDYTFYSLRVDAAEKAAIEAAIRRNHADHYSELFDMKFHTIDAAMGKPLNGMSREAIRAVMGVAPATYIPPHKRAAAADASADASAYRVWKRSRGGGRRKITTSSISMASDIPAVGTKAQVWHGSAKHTSGGLTKSDLVKNKHGRIVSRKKMAAGKKALKYLTRKGYKARKGTFRLFRKHRSTRRQQGGFY